MKNIKTITGFILLLIIVSTTSCKKWIDEDINKDPNQPEDVSMNVLLPGIEVNLAYTFGSDLNRYPSLWIQTMSGLSNQHLAFDFYSFNESDVNNMWYYNLYGGAMSDLYVVLGKASSTGSPHYGGIAKILMANALGTCTDLWGDIPYSEAFQGPLNLKPKYDSQEKIYAEIDTLLTQGISDLGASASTFYPGADDFIYGGDLGNWIAFAHSLKARYYMHHGKRDVSYYSLALAEIPSALSGNDQNTQFNFGVNVTENSPVYQFFSVDRPGDAGVGKNLVDLMNGLNDPRRSVYFLTDGLCTPDTCYSGSAAGSGDGSSEIGEFFNSPTSPTLFMTYSEVKFIEAECAFRTGDAAAAAAAYNVAVSASLEMFGTSDAAYEATNANETSGSITLEKIFTQKYIHMFCQGTEGWTDWRRSHDATHLNGIPALAPAANNVTGGLIPRRFPYPNSERLQNGSNMSAASISQGGAGITDHVWWDNQ